MVVKDVVSSGFRQLLLEVQCQQVTLGKFYCFPRAYDDLPDQIPIHGHTVGRRRPVGGVIFNSRFAVNLFSCSTSCCTSGKEVAGMK